MMKSMRTALPAVAAIAAAGLATVALGSCAMSTSSITSSRYALVYGVSTYYSSIGEGKYLEYNGHYYPNLQYSDDDAASMTTSLANSGWSVSSRTKGSVGTTTELPTKAQMISDLGSIAAKASSDSTVLIYFSGHGDLNNGVSYIVPYLGVSDSTSPTINYSKCISASDLSTMLSVLPTKNVIVIFDTCYSGGFVDSGSATDSAPASYADNENHGYPKDFSTFSTAINNLGSLLVANASAAGSKTPIVISAAGADESSYDGTDSMAHGVFTYYLLKAASNGDTNRDSYIATTEAYAYAYKMIKEEWDTDYDTALFLPHISGGTRDLALFTM